MTYSKELLNQAHKHCSNNRDAINASKVCGCFYCEATYAPSAVRQYVCGGKDAVCPKCGIDSVLADSSLEITAPFLRAMYDRWFGDDLDEDTAA
jgi:hypothetical protein